MHFYFMIRGVKHQCDLFRMFMQTQMFCWKRKNLETGKEEVTMVQGALRECGFVYEYIFPKECLAEVLTMLDVKKDTGDAKNMGAARAWIIRKSLGKGVKPIPEYKEIKGKWVIVEGIYLTTKRYIEKHGIAIYPIGIREDPVKDYDFSSTGEGKWHQEGL